MVLPFLGLQEMLVYFDPWYAGVVLPTLIVVGLMAIPYIDTNPKGNGYYTFAERKFAISVYLFGFIIFWIVLITIGTFLRGANWNFFGPFDYWDPHMQVPLKNINISEIFWVKMLKQGMPSHWLVREAPGLLLVAGYLILAPLLRLRRARDKTKTARPMKFSKRCARPNAATGIRTTTSCSTIKPGSCSSSSTTRVMIRSSTRRWRLPCPITMRSM